MQFQGTRTLAAYWQGKYDNVQSLLDAERAKDVRVTADGAAAYNELDGLALTVDILLDDIQRQNERLDTEQRQRGECWAELETLKGLVRRAMSVPEVATTLRRHAIFTSFDLKTLFDDVGA